jgi:hypothetical protein
LGTNNSPGATRIGEAHGIPFVEILTAYERAPASLTMSYYTGISASYPVPPSGPGERPEQVFLESYAEEFRYRSICAKRGTYIDVISTACGDRPDLAAELMGVAHKAAFKALATAAGAKIYQGPCGAGEWHIDNLSA